MAIIVDRVNNSFLFTFISFFVIFIKYKELKISVLCALFVFLCIPFMIIYVLSSDAFFSQYAARSLELVYAC
jgi:threonine/homoserine/homoserine lactone efflux protein